jgi:branched-subunit amino acid transport protein
MTEVLLVLVVALAVYLPKAVPVLVVPERLPTLVRRWLSYVAPALLSALVAPTVLAPGDRLAPPVGLVAACAVALAVVLATHRLLWALAAGVLVVVLLGAARV